MLDNNKVSDINNSDMEEKHKIIRKIKLILQDKENYNYLPLSNKNVADNILNTNLTNETSLDLKQAKTLIEDIQGLKQKNILKEAKLDSFGVAKGGEQSAIEKTFFSRNIFKEQLKA